MVLSWQNYSEYSAGLWGPFRVRRHKGMTFTDLWLLGTLTEVRRVGKVLRGQADMLELKTVFLKHH